MITASLQLFIARNCFSGEQSGPWLSRFSSNGLQDIPYNILDVSCFCAFIVNEYILSQLS